jgi:hypothetical protein
MSVTSSLLTAVVICSLFPHSAQAATAADSPVHVQSGATPSEGRSELATSELWRAGAAEDGPLFGVIVQVLTDDEGRIYLLDKQQSTVWTFAGDGLFLGTLTREGEGPGEVRRPDDMALLPNGTLGICTAHSGQLVCVNRDGIPRASIRVGGPQISRGETAWLDGVGSRAGTFVFLSRNVSHGPGKQTTTHSLARVDMDGRESCRYFEKTVVDDFADFRINEVEYYYPSGRLWTIGPRGRVYLVPERNRYRIHIHAAHGPLERVIERDFRPVRRDPREKKATREAYEDWYKSLSCKIELEDSEPAITRLMVDEKGFIWVLSSRGVHEQPDGIMATYDVFDEDGRFVREVAVGCAGDGRYDDLFFLGEDRLLLITGAYEAAMALRGIRVTRDETSELVPMEVVCLEIVDGLESR